MRIDLFVFAFVALLGLRIQAAEFIEIPAEMLRDKIRGGLLGQMLGNLNGLPHEMKYIDEPGNVLQYTPALPAGARTDDDTDFEWVYIVEMQRRGEPMLSSSEIAALWRERINRRIWCSNQYARQLMDLRIEPPLTGHVALNPWADFNISGQFLCETFGLIAPAMPHTAARIGLNYTRVAIDGEPAQTTQLFTTMIAMAFVESDVNAVLDAGVAALDPRSEILQIIRAVRQWHSENPADWRQTRALVKKAYSRHDGAMRDRNGYELNTAATIAALLYGDGDFSETLRIAFNFGWDCDNTAATAGTIVGVTLGYRNMLANGWQIVDRYRNTTRQNMPDDETITSFADRLIDLAELVIERNGGNRIAGDGMPAFRIPVEVPEPVLRIAPLHEQIQTLRSEMVSAIEHDLLEDSDGQNHARAAYLAICLDLSDRLKTEHPDEWRRGLAALRQRWNILQALFHHSPVPGAEPLRAKFIQSDVAPPGERKALWK